MKVPDMPHGYMGFLRRRPKTQAEKHYEQALRCRRRKSRDFNFGLAVWRLRQAIELEPANPLFYHELGRAFAALPLLAVVRGGGRLHTGRIGSTRHRRIKGGA
ncbi:MAG: hypothetical protein DRI39_08440 [Chloroflexi bacterium]|nr:MAG: hypothetical protein DRI39_08440 [Chloroflexota bacterium]